MSFKFIENGREYEIDKVSNDLLRAIYLKCISKGSHHSLNFAKDTLMPELHRRGLSIPNA